MTERPPSATDHNKDPYERYNELITKGMLPNEAAEQIYGMTEQERPTEHQTGRNFDEEAKQDILRIVGSVQEIGFLGKVVEGTTIRANPLNGLPSLTVSASGGQHAARTYPADSELMRWAQNTGGFGAGMSPALKAAKNDKYKGVFFEEGDNHLFTARHGKNGFARVALMVHDSTGDADVSGRKSGWQSALFLMPNRDATNLERHIGDNPLAFPYFFNKAAPGLARPETAPSGPGIRADRSKSVTVINYHEFFPVIKETIDQKLTSASLSSGLLKEVWPRATKRIPYEL